MRKLTLESQYLEKGGEFGNLLSANQISHVKSKGQILLLPSVSMSGSSAQ